MEEIWVDIKGYEDKYKISNTGKVFSKTRNKEKSLFQRVKNGSYYVGLDKNGGTYTFRIDKLLYEHFGIEMYNTTNLEGEVWKDIYGYEGFYQISNKGRVKSLERYIWQSDKDGKLYQRFMPSKILSLNRNNGNNYINVQLRTGNGTLENNHYIHILVAEAFIPNPENKPTVNHKDGNRDNNCVDNLEWATQSEQMQHAFDVLNREISGVALENIKLTDNEATEIYKLSIDSKMSNNEIAKLFNICEATVNNIKNKRSHKKIHKNLDMNF